MTRAHSRLLPCALAALLAAPAVPTQADDVETVKKKLDAAKSNYADDAGKFRKSVAEFLDRREADARKAGNKSQLDQVRTERDRFEAKGELPAGCPAGALTQVRAARAALSAAYTTAVRDCIRLKDDVAAEGLEKERDQFVVESGLLFGKRVYLGALKSFDVRVFENSFEKDTARFKVDGEAVPHSIFMHPTTKADAAASFPVGGRATVFVATVGIPKQEKINEPASALTFEVLGDGKSLWKSEPVKERDAFQSCTVRVDRVKALTLRVICPGDQASAHAVWYGPFVIE